MAGSKKVKQKENPSGRYIAQGGNPDQYYNQRPSWNFCTCDQEMWPFKQELVGDSFWSEVLPRLQAWETQTWGDILVAGKKLNHSIKQDELNPIAQARLAERYVEQEAVISLRMQGAHRLYGYIVGAIFNVIWIDLDHGDNDRCVCRSRLKHT